MRWTLRIAAILAVLLLAYAIWPVAGFFRIASAIEARDAAALGKLVDFRALRKNLTKQVVAAYMELTGKEQKLGLLGKTFAVGVGTSYAEPIVAQLLNALIASGGADLDYAALGTVLFKMAGAGGNTSHG